MAYVAPNSTVEFFSDLGLNDNYDDTLYFSSESAKNSYFSNLTKLATATAMSYNREQRGFIRVELPMSTLISASYMRFKNTSFENKWFYAFVNSVEYINNNCTQVNFKIDPMMTWMGTFELGQCYVERQHVTNDSIGANIADEGLKCGEYVCEGSSTTAFFGDYNIVLFRTWNKAKEPGAIVYPLTQGLYVPLVATYYPFTQEGATALQGKIDELIEQHREEEILTIKLIPYHYANNTSIETDTFTVEKPYTSVGGYIPKNKKLFCYPYKYLEVQDCENSPIAYKYEYFNSLPDATSTGYAYFSIQGSGRTPEVNIMCIPYNYNGLEYDYEHACSMSNFPTIPWNVDGYKAYLAQRDSTFFGNLTSNSILGLLGGAISGAAGGALAGAVNPMTLMTPQLGAAMGAATGLAGGLINSIKQPLADIENDMMKGILPSRFPNTARGVLSSNLMAQARTKNFYFRKMCITKNYASMIDDFFTMYGYAIRNVLTPNMNARPYFTYVKTKGCAVHGNVPADDASAIEKIFDNGVRFWKNHNNIGNYSLNNSPA